MVSDPIKTGAISCRMLGYSMFVRLRKPIVREACVFRLQIWYEVDDAVLLRHCVQLKSSGISCFEWSNNSRTQDTSSLLAMLV